MKRLTAFTLIELLVVMGLMVFLAGTVAWLGGGLDGGRSALRANALAASGLIRLARDDARAHGQSVRVLAESPIDGESGCWQLELVRKRESEAIVWDQFGQTLALPPKIEPVVDSGPRSVWNGPELMPIGEGSSRACFFFEWDAQGRPASGAGRMAFSTVGAAESEGEPSTASAQVGIWISSGGEISLD